MVRISGRAALAVLGAGFLVVLTAAMSRGSEEQRALQFQVLEHSVASNLGRTLRCVFEDTPGLQVAVDDRTNKLILRGTQRYLAQAETLITHLDVPVYACETPTDTVLLKHRRGAELARLLQDIAQQSRVFGRRDADAQVSAPCSLRPSFENDPKPAIAWDEHTNALIVAGSSFQRCAIKRLVEALDIEP